MLHENPLSIIESALRAVRKVLVTATKSEREMLALKSPLAWRIGDAILSTVEHTSVERDVRLAELLFAAANLSTDEHERNLDMALTIAARSLLWRAFEIESDGPGEALAQMDVFISLVDGQWLTDHADMMAHLHKLRRQFVRLLDGVPLSHGLEFDRGRLDQTRQTVFEIITGGRDWGGDGGRGKR